MSANEIRPNQRIANRLNTALNEFKSIFSVVLDALDLEGTWEWDPVAGVLRRKEQQDEDAPQQ